MFRDPAFWRGVSRGVLWANVIGLPILATFLTWLWWGR